MFTKFEETRFFENLSIKERVAKIHTCLSAIKLPLQRRGERGRGYGQ